VRVTLANTRPNFKPKLPPAFIIMSENLRNLKLQGQWNVHQQAINCIQFSLDKKYLASGDDEGVLVVCLVHLDSLSLLMQSSQIRETAKNKCICVYRASQAITCLRWDLTKPSLLFVGLSNGELNKVQISPKGVSDHPLLFYSVGPTLIYIRCNLMTKDWKSFRDGYMAFPLTLEGTRLSSHMAIVLLQPFEILWVRGSNQVECR
jgi:WD40 repeat protein